MLRLLLSALFCCFFLAPVVQADPITILNIRFASQNASENIVPILDNDVTSYTIPQGFFYIFFDIYGGVQGCPPCVPQGPVVGTFSGNLALAHASVLYYGTGYADNVSTIGIRTLMPVGIFSGTVSFSLGEGTTPLVYIDRNGAPGINPTFLIEVTGLRLPDPVVVPEPATVFLLISGLGVLLFRRYGLSK